jgi:hypothetical protein
MGVITGYVVLSMKLANKIAWDDNERFALIRRDRYTADRVSEMPRDLSGILATRYGAPYFPERGSVEELRGGRSPSSAPIDGRYRTKHIHDLALGYVLQRAVTK